MSLFRRVRFVLVETSRPGNIGAAARAMKTMGFSELVLVRPRSVHALADAEAVAFASGAQDILAGAVIVESIEEALSSLKEREAKILRLYFGLDGEEPMTLEQIGSLLGITRERVRQIKEKALSRLRHVSRARALESFLG